VALGVVAVLATGCGSGGLWARWRAERDLWRAVHATSGIVGDSHASPAELAHAAGLFQRVVERWPAEVWVPRAGADSLAADVARVSGRAAIRSADLSWRTGDHARAGAAFDLVERTWAPVWPVPLEAGLAHAAAAARGGDSAAACDLRARVAAHYPSIGPDGRLAPGVLDAARGVAEEFRRAGQDARADSASRAFARTLEAALADGPAREAAPQLWLALAQTREASGPAGRAGARVALAHVLRDPLAADLAGDARLALARLALADGDRVHAVALARQAREALPWDRGLDAVAVEASAWEQAGERDSALLAYGRSIDEHWAPDRELTRARAERARLFEDAGRWEEARGELHALIAGDPLSAWAFQSMRQLVSHPLQRNELELAQLEVAWCVDRLNRTLATVLDPGVLLAARRTKADVLLAVGADQRAVAALEDLWRQHPGTPDGVWAAFKAAELAERQDDRATAERMYREVAAGATAGADRREAETRLRRLAAGRMNHGDSQ
jgi:tetratricopeptide (TPR) repeat protein